ncbi:transglutaminase TgpA family protein [Plantactinospora sp. CA-290183]|uniref:transglutaminase TgpA family protein n=1 Tax=Plantactinospora sp. CA-290183 TaxID=3240006 RepID=UPI003D8DDE1E
MRGRRHLGFVAAAATLLASAPLSVIFERWTWLVQCVIAVALVAGAAALVRWWRAPVWAQALSMLGGLLLGLTWMFPSGSELLTVLPTPGTITHFGALLGGSAQDMRSYGAPVQDTDPLLFITVLGVGAVAVVVDLLTVGLRRPALAGLPMLAIYSVPVAVYVDSVQALPFVIGAAGYLWLLAADNVDRVRHFGRRFTGDGRDVDVWEPSPLAAAGRRLAVVGVVVAVLLPLAVPGMTSGLFDRFNTAGDGNGNGRGTGNSPGRVNLFASLSGELNRSEVRDFVRVTTDDPDPYYLRFAVADDLRRTGFAARTPSGSPVTRTLPDPREGDQPAQRGVTRSAHQARVEILDFNMPFLPVYAEPVNADGVDSSWLYDPNRQIVFSNRTQSRGQNYSFEYVRSAYTPEALAAAPSLSAEDPMRRQFAAVEPVREVEELVERLTRNKRSDYEKVRALYDYFSRDNGFSYSLSTEGGTSGQDIVNFLTNKVGFCQQYAAGLAWLVRAAGIPARVALGFTNGNNIEGNTYTLTNLNMHAWTEVYFAQIGWVPFDATPTANVPGSTRSDWAPDVDAPDPLPAAPAPSAGPETDPSAGPAADDRPDRAVDENLGDGAGAAPNSGPSWPWFTAAGLVLLLALLTVPALRRALLRRRRQGQAATASALAASVAGDPSSPGVARVVVSDTELERIRADAHAAWDELIDTMVDFRIPVDPAETPRATAERLVATQVDGEAREAARLLGRAEERARYARQPLRDGSLRDALRSVRRALLAGADRRTRITAATLPPSVLFRWRLAIMDASARFVGVTGQVRDRLLRWNPRRILARASR